MKRSYTSGIGFGLTSGVITTLGILVGLYAGTKSFAAVFSGIVVLALADSLSDAVGMHISTESEKNSSNKIIWETTAATFLAKFITALTFILPLILFPLNWAILVSVIWGMMLITCLNITIAEKKNESAWKLVISHLGIAIFVIIVTHFIGVWIGSLM